MGKTINTRVKYEPLVHGKVCQFFFFLFVHSFCVLTNRLRKFNYTEREKNNHRPILSIKYRIAQRYIYSKGRPPQTRGRIRNHQSRRGPAGKAKTPLFIRCAYQSYRPTLCGRLTLGKCQQRQNRTLICHRPVSFAPRRAPCFVGISLKKPSSSIFPRKRNIILYTEKEKVYIHYVYRACFERIVRYFKLFL